MANLHDQLEGVFQTIFNNDQLQLRDDMSPPDIPGWDSVAHINLMFGIEQAFGIRFTGDELARLETIGELKRLLASRMR
ncbi:MAG: acyl carrier protein [Bryobacteraceae bacterium]|jgi:Acyl carrier protein|nr:acyl carrier protein [Bryobacteraceae bacterium]